MIALACIIFFVPLTYGQEVTVSDDLQDLIPVDENVKVGQLDNGLTYYIRGNDRPEKRLELRLVVNAGSILETEDQLGLAHFLEHMAFNGTKNFEKNELVNYLQSIGVRFGADLNAYTSFDETVYMLPIPTDNDTIVSQGFQILEDWAHNLSFDPEEIEKERGVVIEEWRLGQGADRRMLDEFLPVLLKDSRYASRLPIGTKENLENFEHSSLKNFYKDWYRPELMAVIAVGDLPVDQIEAKIREHFGGIAQVSAPRPRVAYGVPDHPETFVSISTDKEASYTISRLFIKADPTTDTTLGDYRQWLINNLYTGMLNQRLSELTQQAEPPFLFGSVSYGAFFARTKTAFQAFSVTQEDGIEQGLSALLAEIERVKRFGFTATELDRYKKDMLQSYEVAYNERDKTASENYVNEYVGHFLEAEPIPGIAFEYSFVKKYLAGISLAEINAMTDDFIRKENRVLVVTGPEKEGLTYPSKDALLALLNEAENLELTPYDDGDVGTALMAEPPAAGTIASTAYHDKVDITEVKLSNGVTVFLKPTDFKNDQVLMTSFSPGGHSLAGDAHYMSASNAAAIVDLSGVAGYTNVELQKMLAGKSMSVSPFIRELSEGVQGNSTPQDLETLFQLTHLYFTAPTLDMDAFQSFISRNKGFLKNLNSNPQFYFNDQVQRIMSQGHPRGGGFPTEEQLDSIDPEWALAFYKERFADASDFTFWFVGNFDVEEMKPLLATYLGSLPTLERRDEWRDVGVRPPGGMVSETINKGTDPKSVVVMNFTDAFERTREEHFYFGALADLVDIKLIEILREEKSGVYGAGSNANTSGLPYEHYTFRIQFPCAPENVDDLVAATKDIISAIQDEEVSQENLKKIREQRRRSFEVNIKENNYWLNSLRSYYINDWDFNEIPESINKLDDIEGDKIRAIAKKYLNTEEYIQIVLMPKGE